jgi:hypothetical protein
MVLSVVDTRAWLGRRCSEMVLDEHFTKSLKHDTIEMEMHVAGISSYRCALQQH